MFEAGVKNVSNLTRSFKTLGKGFKIVEILTT